MICTLLLSLQPALGAVRCTYDAGTTIGNWGGGCTCPDGRVYWVSDKGDHCASLACKGGQSGECNQHIDAKWANKKVNCEAPLPPEPPTESPTCHTPTVAYAFIIRDELPFWDLWAQYFQMCPQGAVLPVVHTQANEEGRATLQAQLQPFGGKLVPQEDAHYSNPRWDFLASAMFFTTFRVAGATKALNGCEPQWVHMLTEADVPVRSCSYFHERLARDPGVSHIGQIKGQGPRLAGPFDDVDEPIRPAAHRSHLVTLSMPHALALAHDECELATKWRPYLVHNVWDHPWSGFSRSGGQMVWGTPDEMIFFTELSQRNMPFKQRGHTIAWFYGGDEHPRRFSEAASIRWACREAQKEDYFFARKIYAPSGDTKVVLDAVLDCIQDHEEVPLPARSPLLVLLLTHPPHSPQLFSPGSPSTRAPAGDLDALLPPRPPPSTKVSYCGSWCAENTKPWAEKCAMFAKCTGCDPCFQLPPPSPSLLPSPKQPPYRLPQPFSTMPSNMWLPAAAEDAHQLTSGGKDADSTGVVWWVTGAGSHDLKLAATVLLVMSLLLGSLLAMIRKAEKKLNRESPQTTRRGSRAASAYRTVDASSRP